MITANNSVLMQQSEVAGLSAGIAFSKMLNFCTWSGADIALHVSMDFDVDIAWTEKQMVAGWERVEVSWAGTIPWPMHYSSTVHQSQHLTRVQRAKTRTIRKCIWDLLNGRDQRKLHVYNVEVTGLGHIMQNIMHISMHRESPDLALLHHVVQWKQTIIVMIIIVIISICKY